uniref:Uncharacterized protein n=1 Tax=Arundo donax TaxID=35708 RepID=A0A0A9FIM2_ARUDO
MHLNSLIFELAIFPKEIRLCLCYFPVSSDSDQNELINVLMYSCQKR